MTKVAFFFLSTLDDTLSTLPGRHLQRCVCRISRGCDVAVDAIRLLIWDSEAPDSEEAADGVDDKVGPPAVDGSGDDKG